MLSAWKQLLINLPGVRTKRKLITFLADDYGTIRISSPKAVESLQNVCASVTENRFNRFDGIATSSDLTALFEVLNSVKDKNNRSAVFTPVTIVANPDFERIRTNQFSSYHYETFFETLERLPDADHIQRLWKEGMESGIFVPEFHGREHLNVRFWMRLLQSGDKHVREAFDRESIGINPVLKNKKYMAAFDPESLQHQLELKEIATDGLGLFEKQFGYKATLFTPSALIHHDSLHDNLKKDGIGMIDMARLRYEPTFKGGRRRRFHFMGETNKQGQHYLTRNVMFEPNEGNRDWVGSAMKGIETAFTFRKPAIISTHRVNFAGSKCEVNRDQGLKSLQSLLSKITRTWPDVEFVPAREIFNRL